jgi:hypothetical protein
MAYTTIDDPSAYHHTQLYTGNGSSGHSITNDANAGNFKPDWLWLKPRSASDNHVVLDSSRTSNKRLKVNSSDAEDSDSTAQITFESDGFDLDTTDGNFNGSGTTYVAWQWKCNGGVTTSFSESGNNPGGDRQANATAGFSIIDYVGTGGAGTIEHGLGKVPKWIVFKDRSSDGDDWFVYHITTGNDGGVRLNSNTADGDDSNRFNNTSPTTSVFTVGASGGVNDDTKPTIAYCFAPIQGYSKFGSYKGIGGSDGSFVYLGFKPAWILFKRTDATEDWFLFDSKRDISNPNNDRLLPNLNNAESESEELDFLSNGFKIRTGSSAVNTSGGTYIYMAFAEHPFVSSKGVPATAK